jgi:hypothetical protein
MTHSGARPMSQYVTAASLRRSHEESGNPTRSINIELENLFVGSAHLMEFALFEFRFVQFPGSQIVAVRSRGRQGLRI